MTDTTELRKKVDEFFANLNEKQCSLSYFCDNFQFPNFSLKADTNHPNIKLLIEERVIRIKKDPHHRQRLLISHYAGASITTLDFPNKHNDFYEEYRYSPVPIIMKRLTATDISKPQKLKFFNSDICHDLPPSPIDVKLNETRIPVKKYSDRNYEAYPLLDTGLHNISSDYKMANEDQRTHTELPIEKYTSIIKYDERGHRPTLTIEDHLHNIRKIEPIQKTDFSFEFEARHITPFSVLTYKY